MIELDPELFDVEELKKKRHIKTGPAYHLIIGHAWIEAIAYEPKVLAHGIVPLDCDGDPIPRGTWGLGSSTHIQLIPGGLGWYPNWACWIDWGRAPGDGIIKDMRKFLDILMGCCPKWQLD